MKNIIFDDEGNIRKKIKTSYKNKFKEYLTNQEILGYHGYDPGIHDNAALLLLHYIKLERIIVLKVIEEISKINSTKTY